MNGKIKSFTDLDVWREGHKLVLQIYKTTRLFPKEEIYALVSQLRRAAASITSNIAEGFSRKSYTEKIQFYFMALGSLTEVQNQILIAKDVNYIEQKKFREIAEQTVTVSKLLNGIIRSSKKYS